MQHYMNTLADHATSLLKGDERYLLNFSAEDSDFVRLNHAQVRQAGSVRQRVLALDLIQGNRHAPGSACLSGDAEMDRARIATLIESLRAKLPHLPDDPYLLYSTEVRSTERHAENQLSPANEVVARIQEAAKGLDLVGLYASGGIHNGFANSMGQRNWFTSYSFNFDFSVYHQGDKAVKADFAGLSWDSDAFARRMALVREQFTYLTREPRTIPPGHYRVYLAPAAMQDLLGTLAWGGFGLKDHRTKQTTLIRMVEGDAKLHPSVTIKENVKEGVSASFNSSGYLKAEETLLIDRGEFRSCLASPRSAKEYNVPTNGANDFESPESTDLAAGDIPRDEVLKRLGTGLYVNNLHYLNYSDRPACRMTGMTRFATFWVENGEIVAPVNVMRFDETVYRVLGENLIGLTRERDLLLDSSTYFARSTASMRLPGALVDGFHFTL